MLSQLFKHKDMKVRNAALEVYIRRVYRAHTIDDVLIKDKDGLVLVNWNYRLRDAPPQACCSKIESFVSLSVLFSLATSGALSSPRAQMPWCNVASYQDVMPQVMRPIRHMMGDWPFHVSCLP